MQLRVSDKNAIEGAARCPAILADDRINNNIT
jgi:hypothetical protein